MSISYSRTSMVIGLTTSPRARARAIFRRGMESRSPTGTLTVISTCLSNSAARRPGDQAFNALFQNPGQGRSGSK